MRDEEKNPVMRYAVVVITVIVSAIILFALMPIIGVANSETRIADNEGASDLKFSLEKGKTFTRSYSITLDSTIEITGGAEDITVLNTKKIVYADDNLSIISSGFRFYLIADGYTSPAPSIGQWFTIKNDAGGIKITPGFGADTGTLTFPKPTWVYLPNMDGDYAYFQNGTEVRLTEDSVEAVAGLYGGWGAYNRVAFDLHTDRTEDAVSSAYWSIAVEGSTSYTEPGDGSLSTPRLYDGVWTYTLYPDSQTATIVEYTGPGGDIVVPATVGGYPVLTVGTPTGQIFDCDITSLTIEEGIKNIDFKCFCPLEGRSYTGKLVLPESLEYIGSQAFRFAHFDGNLIIPKNVGYIGYNAFEGCSFTSMAVESSATPLDNAYASTSIEQVLNLGDAPYLRNSYGLAADSVSDQITADGFVANAHYTYTAQRTGTISMLFWLIPLVFLIGLAVYFIHRINNHNEIIGGWKR